VFERNGLERRGRSNGIETGVVVGDTSWGDLKNGLYAVNRSEEWVICREFYDFFYVFRSVGSWEAHSATTASSIVPCPFVVSPNTRPHPLPKYIYGNVRVSYFQEMDSDDLLSRISYRGPTTREDVQECYAIEVASFPSDEAESIDRLEFRQTHAHDYFQCAFLDDSHMVGFIMATRCTEFSKDSMSTHVPTGRLLAIHSVAVKEEFSRKGIASAMLKAYLRSIQEGNVDGSLESFVLLSKAYLLGFYVNCGFQVNRVSSIVHGRERWYELELSIARRLPKKDESWYYKTERFKRPLPEMQPFLQEHKEWVLSLRRQGFCITSGYRVDKEGQHGGGGGGLMFLAAKSYDDAVNLVMQDPLVTNDCVEWEVYGWIGQVGDIQMR
jgi:ribosomal protein S18 acetylase RimI-like enzyme/uncharacterized protein YciI